MASILKVTKLQTDGFLKQDGTAAITSDAAGQLTFSTPPSLDFESVTTWTEATKPAGSDYALGLNTDVGYGEFYINNQWNNIYDTAGLISNGLILHYDAQNRDSIDEGGSTWYDLSGNNNNGTLTNSPYYDAGAIKFNGSNTYVDTGLTRQDLGDSFTISITYRYVGSYNRTYSALFAGGSLGDFFVGKDSGNLNLGVQDGNYISDLVPGSNAFDHGWHNVVYTFNNPTGTIYIDGKSRGTGTFTKARDSDTLLIGSEVTSQDYVLDGYVSRFLVYNRVLSFNEIQRIYNVDRKKIGA